MASAKLPRLAAFDDTKSLVIVLVVLHHAVLAYCQYAAFNPAHYLWSTAPVVDSARWRGFDLIVLFNDGFFMPLMFLLSGLFVWPSLRRKGARHYVVDRLLRLGLPFVVVALTVIPLAYYPSFRLTGAGSSVAEYWLKVVTAGPFPSGPNWFIAELLVFDLASAVILALVNRRPSAATPRWWLLGCLPALAYLPMILIFGPERWLVSGPVSMQASRILLYATYFGAGVWAGRGGPVPLIAGLARDWRRWALLVPLLFAVLVALRIVRPAMPELTWRALYGIALPPFCAATGLALTGWFAREGRVRAAKLWDALRANAYGIFLLHYPAVTWLQYWLLPWQESAIAKAAIVFTAAFAASWAATALLRRIPAVAAVI